MPLNRGYTKNMLEKIRNRKHSYIGEKERRHYSVVIPVVKEEDSYKVLFEVRASNIDRQPGEICLPGGAREENESSLQAAVRETCEELKINEEQLDVICEMDTFLNDRMEEVHVFLSELRDYKYTFSEEEVEEVFTVPIEFFLNEKPEIYRCRTLHEFPENFPFHKIPGGKEYPWYTKDKEVYFYTWEDRVIWGLTGRIMDSSAEIIRSETDLV